MELINRTMAALDEAEDKKPSEKPRSDPADDICDTPDRPSAPYAPARHHRHPPAVGDPRRGALEGGRVGVGRRGLGGGRGLRLGPRGGLAAGSGGGEEQDEAEEAEEAGGRRGGSAGRHG